MTQLTAEQLAAGYLPHDGGPCPVPLNSKPEVVFADGNTAKAFGVVEARRWAEAGMACRDWWQHEGHWKCHIIGYLPDPNYVKTEKDREFCSVVWAALKGDHTDLQKQQIILEAHRAKPTPDPLSALLAPDEALVEAVAKVFSGAPFPSPTSWRRTRAALIAAGQELARRRDQG